MNYTEERPWGKFENLLESDYCKVKQITVKPGGRLSYQYHDQRSERWVLVQGKAVVKLDDFEYDKEAGDAIYIPQGMKHNIWNPYEEDCIFIEVQTGTYFGEDDIIRLNDIYGRI
ncbi:phosphomannose isomerase type II C-terminal cupin domain [bacterium]|jgi:mannose-6-phosphate isomerase|nr:phosphomannose isomerase type II C-terminal cupin domain [bacterium]